MTRPVVVTGMGWITPLGQDLDTVWSALISGQSGIKPTTRFDASTFPTRIAGQVADSFDWKQSVRDTEQHGHPGRHTTYALHAAAEAWRMAGLDQSPPNPNRSGIYLGAGEGPLDFVATCQSHMSGVRDEAYNWPTWGKTAQQAYSREFEAEQEPFAPARHLALEYDLRGPTSNCLTACAAGTQSIGEATHLIRRGEADLMLTGGTHTMLHELGVTGFNRLTALSTANEDPTAASRPFSRTRGGFVMGEGSAIVILESAEHAAARGATPLAEIAGYGSTADAYRITDMHPEGALAAAAMRAALQEANIDPQASTGPGIDYISAHGTGTSENDRVETMAIKSVFGDHAPEVPVSSVKSMLGHLICAAGAAELVVCVQALRNGMLPPTANLTDQDPALDLDYVPLNARPAEVRACLSNSFGFGGQNSAIVVRAWPSEAS